jgi:hypothetical protein
MTDTFTPDDDPDLVDRARSVDLAAAGLPGYCAAIAINSSGEEILMLAAYNQGEADYVTDWNSLAPHEIPGLSIYLKED